MLRKAKMVLRVLEFRAFLWVRAVRRRHLITEDALSLKLGSKLEGGLRQTSLALSTSKGSTSSAHS